jgi:PEP-CTERM motif-containing protein
MLTGRSKLYVGALACLLVAVLTAPAGADITEVVPFSLVQSTISAYTAGMGVPSSYDKWTSAGTTAYAIVKQGGDWSWMLKVNNAGTPGQTGEVFYAWPDTFGTGASLCVQGDYIAFISSGDDAAYRIHTTTGVRETVMSAAELLAETGGDGIVSGYTGQAPDGEVVFYETDMDQLVKVNPAAANNCEIYISNAELTAAMGDAKLQGQLAWDGDGRLYVGNTTTDSLYRFDPSDRSITEVIGKQQLSDLVGNADQAGTAGQVYNPADGYMYFRELYSRDVLRFSPSDPSGTLEYYLNDDAIEQSTVGTDILGYFSTFGDSVAFSAYNQGGMGYYVPEPATLALLGLGAVALIRRK